MLVRLTKQKAIMQDHPNINDDFEMVGELLKFEEGQSLVVVNEHKSFVSSTVIKKEEFPGYKLAYTNNSVYRIENATPVKEPVIDQGPFDRARRKAQIYAQTHKAGTPVVAESKDGSWKDGVIIGEHDWALFTFFFTIRFNDGEIIKQEETKVTVVKKEEAK